MKKTVKKLIIIFTLTIFLLFLIVYTIIMDRSPVLTKIEVGSESLPTDFNDFKIAHISDFHNAELDKNNKKLCDMLKDADPDIIVITGDLIDSRRTDIDIVAKFIDNITEIAPCYYVTGNHESRVSEEFTELEKVLASKNVTVLRGESTVIEREGSIIEILGIDDPDFTRNKDGKTNQDIISEEIGSVISSNDNYKILLSHRPEAFDIYVQHDIDLIFAGHAHGGQIRLPFIGGIIAPGQGFFPKYDSGLYVKNDTSMVVSRGIGNSLFPLRINNKPEIIMITLKTR